MTSWPFSKLDMKPGTLHKVRASCTFGVNDDTIPLSRKTIDIKKDEILMSLGWSTLEGNAADFRFDFLYGEKRVFLPFSFGDDIDEDSTEEEKVEAIQVRLFTFVKPVHSIAHGYAPPSVPVEPHLIGDSRFGDDDGWDEFH